MSTLTLTFLRMVKMLCICILIGNVVMGNIMGKENRSQLELNLILVVSILVTGTLIYNIMHKTLKGRLEKFHLEVWETGHRLKIVLTILMLPATDFFLRFIQMEDKSIWVLSSLVFLTFLISHYLRYFREDKISQFRAIKQHGNKSSNSIFDTDA